VALRRSRRDAYARRNLWRALLSLLLFAAWAGWYGYFILGSISELGSRTIIIMAIPGLGVLLLAWLIGFKQRLEDRAQERDNPSVPVELKRALFRETVLLATLLERLGSEVAMEKELPPEITVITRRVLLDRLERHDLRHNLEPWLLDLLLAPDGHWTIQQKEKAHSAWECFAVLKWALGLGELRGLTMTPIYHLRDAHSLCDLDKPEKFRVLPSWDLRPARDAALAFLDRCLGELLARNAVSSASEKDVARALEMRAAIQSEGYTHDYVVGTRTILELDTPLLWLLVRRAHTRFQLASLLVSITSGELPIEKLRDFLARYFVIAAPVHDDPSE
jgi:hypothetical protein